MSKSNYFYRSSEWLDQGHKEMLQFLDIKNFTPDQIGWFEDAYSYFRKNPSHYDGATLSQDLYSIPGLELWSMLHDYFYIALNVWASKKYMRKADKILRLTMHKGDNAGFEMNLRTVKLFFLRGFYPWYNRQFKGRVMTKHNKVNMRLAYADFAK